MRRVAKRLDAVPPPVPESTAACRASTTAHHDRGHTYLPAHLLHTLDDVVAGVIHVAEVRFAHKPDEGTRPCPTTGLARMASTMPITARSTSPFASTTSTSRSRQA